tara:strand:+ start:1864 stop:2382 length:519 start_codon:yes stop_codon:yes gene_type:complete
MEHTLKIGQVISAGYSTYVIKDIQGETVKLSYLYRIYTDTVETTVSKILELLRTPYQGLMNVLYRINDDKKNEYKHVIIDLNNNIAISKMPKSEFSKKTSGVSIAKYKKIYEKNIKLLFVSDEKFIVDDPLIIIDKGFDEYMVDMGFFLWKDCPLDLFVNVADYYSNVINKK